MPFNESVPCWNGPSCLWFAVGSCLFNHGGEEGHLPRTGGTMETKEQTLRVDHLEQEILFSIRLMPRIDSGSRGEIHEEAQPHREPDQSDRQMKPRSGRSPAGVLRWQAVEEPLTLQRAPSQRSKWGESRWSLARVRVRAGWLTAGSRSCGRKHIVARAGLAAATQHTSCAALSQRQGDYGGVAFAGAG